MATPTIPFNIGIMKLDQQTLSRVPRVTTAETYDGLQGQLHPQGLFSPVLFGEQGSVARDYTFGYIKLNTTIIHPYVCRWLKLLRRMHESIWKGEIYVTFNEKTGEFEESNVEEGQTGYAYFMAHIHKLKFKKNKSVKRSQIIDNMEKWKDRYFLNEYLVLPAGLRDIMTDVTGKVTEDEINDYYRKLIRLSTSLESAPRQQGRESDNIRVSMQMVANDIYEHIKTLLEGKKGFLLGKFGSRNVHWGTRNVISSMDTASDDLDDNISVDSSICGLFQTLKGCLPLVTHLIRTHPIYLKAFPQTDDISFLVHPTSLKRVQVQVKDTDIDLWTTVEGNDRIVSRFEKISFRNQVIIVKGHYLGLIYRDKEKYQILSDIDDLPEGWDRKYVYPLTYGEFLYLIGKKEYYEQYAQVTRYPVTGDGSVYIANPYIKTTIPADKLLEYEQGEPTGQVAREVPIRTVDSWYATVSVHPTRVPGLGADFDGDTVTHSFIMSKEAHEEIKKNFGKRTSILRAGNELAYAVENDIIKRVMKSLSRPMDAKRSRRGES